MQHSWSPEMSSDYNRTMARNICTIAVLFFKSLFFQPIWFHVIAVEECCMHGYCFLWKFSFLSRVLSAVWLWLSKLVMYVKICQRWHFDLHGFRCQVDTLKINVSCTVCLLYPWLSSLKKQNLAWLPQRLVLLYLWKVMFLFAWLFCPLSSMCVKPCNA